MINPDKLKSHNRT